MFFNSLVIVIVILASMKISVRSHNFKHSNISIVFAFKKTLFLNIVCLTSKNTRSSSKFILKIMKTLIFICVRIEKRSRYSFY